MQDFIETANAIGKASKAALDTINKKVYNDSRDWFMSTAQLPRRSMKKYRHQSDIDIANRDKKIKRTRTIKKKNRKNNKKSQRH